MNYLELRIIFKNGTDPEIAADAITTELAEIGFESFSETSEGLNAFIPESEFDPISLPDELLNSLAEKWETSVIQAQNWNAVWEENYEPVSIDDQVYVYAHFHPEKPHVKHTIKITPKMSFGTGHHSTTELVMRHMLETDFDGKSVLDLGTGTGILAILANQLGASDLTATEIEDFALENCRENFALNDISQFSLFDARAEQGPYGFFDVVIANITRNTLMALQSLISESCVSGGVLIISGFFLSDCEFLIQEFAKAGFRNPEIREKNNWASIKFFKS